MSTFYCEKCGETHSGEALCLASHRRVVTGAVEAERAGIAGWLWRLARDPAQPKSKRAVFADLAADLEAGKDLP